MSVDLKKRQNKKRTLRGRTVMTIEIERNGRDRFQGGPIRTEGCMNGWMDGWMGWDGMG